MSRAQDVHCELIHAWSELQNSLQEARASWKDDVALQFAKRFMSPWESEMPTFFLSLERLERELQDARHALR